MGHRLCISGSRPAESARSTEADTAAAAPESATSAAPAAAAPAAAATAATAAPAAAAAADTSIVFAETYDLPDDSNIDAINADFDDGMIIVSIPKIVQPRVTLL